MMLPFPAKISDPVTLADWLEVNALANKDRQVSLEILVTAALSSSVFHSDHNDSKITESLLPSIVEEVSFRENYTSYPFSLNGSSLECHIDCNIAESTYMFCLALSVLPWRTPRIRGCFPERIFEEISVCSLRNYINGEAIRFGWPRVRTVLPSRFGAAITQISELMGEGGGATEFAVNSGKNDAGVDVVSWKKIDDRMGKMMIWGSCATGDNWEQKLRELDPSSFCRQYFNSHPELLPAKSFFTSHVVSRQEWREYTRRAGILFDRLRISTLNPTIPMNTPHGNGEHWLLNVIDYLHGNSQ